MTRRRFPPDHLARLTARISADITRKKHLNPVRRHRSYPRVVRRARHNHYRVKHPTDIGVRHPGPATITITTRST